MVTLRGLPEPDARTVRVRLTDWLCVGLPESVTLKVRGADDTACVGLPVMAPVLALSESPVGNEPLVTDHVSGPVPPVATRGTEYAVPTCPLGSDVVVIERTPGATCEVAPPQPERLTTANGRMERAAI